MTLGGTVSVSQAGSGGASCPDIHHAALIAADAQPGLTWLDIGCGDGTIMRSILGSQEPEFVTGVDLIDWLQADLGPNCDVIIGPAEQVLAERQFVADRVLLVETLEHVDAPWSILRAAARCVAPGGRLVVTTPNIASLRHRIELLIRGSLTAFRPDNSAHLTPVLPHVVNQILDEEEMQPNRATFAGRDVVPWTGGRHWASPIHRRFAPATSVSVVISADRVPA